MNLSPGRKFEIKPSLPDLYGRISYYVSNGEVMSPRGYPSKLAAELVAAAWNGDDTTIGNIAGELVEFLQDFDADSNDAERLEKLRERARKLLNRDES